MNLHLIVYIASLNVGVGGAVIIGINAILRNLKMNKLFRQASTQLEWVWNNFQNICCVIVIDLKFYIASNICVFF